MRSVVFGRAAALVAIFTICMLSAARAAGAATVATVLAQARAAKGGAAFDRAMTEYGHGDLTIAGIKGHFDEWADVASGGFAQTTDAGPFAGASGFDGHVNWNQDWSGLVWVDAGKAGVYGAIVTAYLANDDLLRPDRRGAVALVGRRSDRGVGYDIIQATPPGGVPIQIWLNARTHLMARAIFTIGTMTSTITFANYRRIHGVQVAFAEHSSSDTGNTSDAILRSVQLNPPGVAAHLAKPPSHVADFSIAGGSQTTVPITLTDNHVYLSVMLNGKGPYNFAFDTGGSNIVDAGIAQAIGLTTSGSLQGSGVGAQTEGFSFAKVATLDVGGATVNDQYFAVLPVKQGFSVAAGVPIDGLIGFEVLSRFITTFDYQHLTLTLRMPSGGAPSTTGGDTIPFVFNNTIPQIACQLDGIAGDCSVDTGSRSSLDVLAPFIAAHPTVVPANATGVGVDGFGIGGASLGKLGRLQTLRVGNTELDDLIAGFSVSTKGYFANPFVAANIGGGTWRRFTVTFDYPNQTMTLVRNAAFDQRDTYDRSGLFLAELGGKPTVVDARPGTPAAQAGIMRGDAITAIGGTPTSGMDLSQVRRLLSGPAGTTLKLTVAPKVGTPHDVELVLKDYV